MASTQHDSEAFPGPLSVKHWSAAFIGLDWREKGRDRDGIDCWGLAALVYAEVLRIDLPSYADAYASIAERGEIAALFAADASRWPWRKVDAPEEFDIALFRRGRLESHVGVVVATSRMLHVTEGRLSSVERYDDGRWRPRLKGFYRHAGLDARR